MIELVVYIDGVRKSVDLYKDEPINLELSFAEVQDITTKTGGYTKSFTVPGSKNNNGLFNHFYNPSSVGITYDSRVRYDATIFNRGYELINGYIRLESATRTNEGVEYTITFYGELGDLVSKVADKTLRDLDLSDYNHSYTFENISTSWNLDESNGFTGLLNGSIMYPLLDRGGIYREETDGSETRIKPFDFNLSGTLNQTARYDTTQNRVDLNYEYFAPAIQLKTLFEEICKQSGFTVESEYFDELWFKRIYLPLTTTEGQFGLLQNEPYTWTVQREAFFNITGGNTTNLDLVTVVDDENGVWNTGLTPNQMVSPRRGYYEIEVNFDYVNKTLTDTDIIVGLYNYSSGFVVDNLLTSISGSESGNSTVKLFAYLEPSATYTHTFGLPGGGGNVDITNVNIQVLSYPNAVYGQQVRIADNFPKEYKQIDIISSVLKHFNLVAVPKPNDTRVISVEPLRKWIGRGEIVDWTDKLDRSKPTTITDTTKFVNGTFELNVKESNDTENKSYKDKADKVFQTRKQPLTTDYRDKVLRLDSKFGIPLSERILPTLDFTIPSFYQETTSGKGSDNVKTIRKPINLFPQLIYYTGRRNANAEIGVYLNYDLTQTSLPAGVKLEIQSWYPQSHHLTYFPVVTFSQNRSVGFNKDELQGTYTQIEVHADSYTLYYEDIVNDYLDKESRFLVGDFYLTPEDVKLIDFRERILIDNTFYRINKISNYNLSQGGLCTVELVKLIKDYSLYDFRDELTDEVRLQACGVGVDDLYTTLNLTPTIYQYTGLIVKVGGVCYRVEPPTQYNPSNNHQQILLDKNAGGQVLYFNECSDCGESGNFCEDVVDIEPTYGGGGTTLIGRFVYEEFFGSGYDCNIQAYYWDCNSGDFITDDEGGQGSCSLPDGWNNLPSSGTTQIPAPILRDGYLLEECCVDQNTGFAYDVYVEIDTDAGGRAGTMIMHKLCCDVQPTTTTSTTAAPTTTTTTTISGGGGDEPVDPTTTTTTTVSQGGVYLVRECDGGTTTTVVNSQTTLFGGDIVYISGSANVGKCWEVLDLSNQPPVEIVLQVYIDCTSCLQDNGGIEQGTTTTTTQEPEVTTTTTQQQELQVCKFVFVPEYVNKTGYGLRYRNNDTEQNTLFDNLMGTSTTYNGDTGVVYAVCSTLTPLWWQESNNTLYPYPNGVVNLPDGGACTNNFNCVYMA